MISFGEFLSKWDGKFCEVSDPSNLNQCFDLAIAWVDNLSVPREAIRHLYAYEIYTRPNDLTLASFELVPNTPNGIPKIGDIVIFDKSYNGTAGHVGVATGVGDNNSFELFEQNDPLKSPCHKKNYNYVSVLGWLRFRAEPQILKPLEYLLTPQSWIDLGVQDKPIDHSHNVGTLIKDLGLQLDINSDLSKKVSELTISNNELQNIADTATENAKKVVDQALLDKNTAERNLASLTMVVGGLKTEVENLTSQVKTQQETIAERDATIQTLQDDPLSKLSPWDLIKLGVSRFFGRK